MKSVLVAAVLAVSLLPVSAQAQAEPAQSELGMLQKIRGKLIGKWLNIRGEVIVFSNDGMVTLAGPDLPVDPKSPTKEVKGTFAITSDLQLKVIIKGKALVSEFSVDSGLLRIRAKSGGFSEYQHYDSKNVADLMLREMQMLDSAIDQWAIEKNKKAGDRPTAEELRKYIHKNTRLFHAVGDADGPKDFLGNSYGIPTVDTVPKIHPLSAKALPDIPKSFWKTHID